MGEPKVPSFAFSSLARGAEKSRLFCNLLLSFLGWLASPTFLSLFCWFSRGHSLPRLQLLPCSRDFGVLLSIVVDPCFHFSFCHFYVEIMKMHFSPSLSISVTSFCILTSMYIFNCSSFLLLLAAFKSAWHLAWIILVRFFPYLHGPPQSRLYVLIFCSSCKASQLEVIALSSNSCSS